MNRLSYPVMYTFGVNLLPSLITLVPCLIFISTQQSTFTVFTAFYLSFSSLLTAVKREAVILFRFHFHKLIHFFHFSSEVSIYLYFFSLFNSHYCVAVVSFFILLFILAHLLADASCFSWSSLVYFRSLLIRIEEIFAALI